MIEKTLNFFSFCVVFGAFFGVQAQSGPVVNTFYGPVEGYDYTTPGGYETQVFLGIPYASAPIGNLRFEKPQPPQKWTSTRQAKGFGPDCATIPKYAAANASEDCLFMNIVRPKTTTSTVKKDVLVFLHGGGFVIGSGAANTNPTTYDNIVANDIIFVSINYRLAVFGFLSTGTSEAKGNYGLWDIVEALKFVQKVIPQFGGNPNKITIIDHSAGAQAVAWLSLAPAASNLFQKAIIMSGNTLSHGIDTSTTFSKNLTDILGCSKPKNVKACLATKNTTQIQAALAVNVPYVVIADSLQTIIDIYGPRVDGDLIKTSNIRLANLLAKRREYFMGSTSQELGTYAITSSFSDPNAKYYPIAPSKATNYTLEDFKNFVINVLGTKEAYGNRRQEAANEIIEFYKHQDYSPDNYYLQVYAQVLSDVKFNVPLLREARMKVLAGNKVNLYMYDYRHPYYNTSLIKGSGHGSEQYNLYGNVNTPIVGTAVGVQKVVKDLVVSFTKTGNPSSGALHNPDGHVRPGALNYFHIKINSTFEDDLWSQRLRFWNNLARKYGFDWPEYRKVTFFEDL